MFQAGSEEIRKQKEKAFSIFTKTKARLQSVIDQARSHVEVNNIEIQKRKEENVELYSHIQEMETSARQIDSIIGK